MTTLLSLESPARVAVALSGGLDSAVAAQLLLRQGLSAWGVHLWLAGEAAPPPELARLARRLPLELEVLDLRGEFSRQIMDYFGEEYFRGRTPNPCARCNAALKFGAGWQEVKARGATHLATGHYARLGTAPDGSLGLFRARDRTKDQSYFLCRLPRELLPQVLFPLGELSKRQVRAHAQELGLALPSNHQESQDICFIPQGNYQEFLRERWGWQGLPGDLVDRRGQVLGRHRGIEHFTVGQRRGLKTPGPEPYYVLEIQPEARRVVIGPKGELSARGLWARQANWLINPPTGELSATAVIRHRHPGVNAAVRIMAAGDLEVIFATPQTAVAPGQVLALYDGDQLLGGAWIEARLA